MDLDSILLDQYLLPPISLQVLMENAIKHNEFSDNNPLMMSLTFDNGELVFQNFVRRKTLRRPSSKIGLQNLSERYRLITQRSIGIAEEEKTFTVRLPRLKIE